MSDAIGELLERDALRTRRFDDRHAVADAHAGNVPDVDRRVVHRHAPDDARAAPAHEHFALVSKAPREAVVVADGQRRDARRLARRPRAAVPDRRARGHVLEEDHLAVQAHHGAQRVSARQRSRQHAVGADARPHAVVLRLDAGEQAGGIRRVDPATKEPTFARCGEHGLEHAQLLLREIVLHAAAGRHVRHDAAELEVTRARDAFEQLDRLRGQHSQALEARVESTPTFARSPRRSHRPSSSPPSSECRPISMPWRSAALASSSTIVPSMRMRARTPALRLERLRRRADAERAHSATQRVARDRDRAVTVRIGLHDEHHAHARIQARTDLAEVVSQGIEIDLGPSAIGIHHEREDPTRRMRFQRRRELAAKPRRYSGSSVVAGCSVPARQRARPSFSNASARGRVERSSDGGGSSSRPPARNASSSASSVSPRIDARGHFGGAQDAGGLDDLERVGGAAVAREVELARTCVEQHLADLAGLERPERERLERRHAEQGGARASGEADPGRRAHTQAGVTSRPEAATTIPARSVGRRPAPRRAAPGSESGRWRALGHFRATGQSARAVAPRRTARCGLRLEVSSGATNRPSPPAFTCRSLGREQLGEALGVRLDEPQVRPLDHHACQRLGARIPQQHAPVVAQGSRSTFATASTIAWTPDNTGLRATRTLSSTCGNER